MWVSLALAAEDPFEKFISLFYSGGVSHFYENSRLAKTPFETHSETFFQWIVNHKNFEVKFHPTVIWSPETSYCSATSQLLKNDPWRPISVFLAGYGLVPFVAEKPQGSAGSSCVRSYLISPVLLIVHVHYFFATESLPSLALYLHACLMQPTNEVGLMFKPKTGEQCCVSNDGLIWLLPARFLIEFLKDKTSARSSQSCFFRLRSISFLPTKAAWTW